MCQQLAQKTVASVSTNLSSRAEAEVNCSMNIMMFGILEDRDLNAWRQKVDDVLKFVAGRAVDVLDIFRIGRFHEGKNHPVVIKLSSIWDRQILLNSANDLKNYGGRVCISPDEPLEERLPHILQHMKLHAELEGKSVSLN